jgi:hypothetical protein
MTKPRETTVTAQVDGHQVRLGVPRRVGARFEDVHRERQLLFQLKQLLRTEIAQHEANERLLAQTLVMVPVLAPTKKGGLKRRLAWGHIVTGEPEERRPHGACAVTSLEWLAAAARLANLTVQELKRAPADVLYMAQACESEG